MANHDHGLIITDKSITTPHDTIQRLAWHGVEPPVHTVVPGAWNDPSTWGNNQVPGLNARVVIPDGISINLAGISAPLDSLEISGSLYLAGGFDTKLILNDLLIMPGGKINIVTLDPNITTEIIFRDTPLKTDVDPSQYGKGLICFGECGIVGYKRTGFLRLAAEPLAGDTTVTLIEAPVGWLPGDRVLIPDTRQIRWAGTAYNNRPVFTSQGEERIIASITGSVVTLNQPLTFDHRGPRDAHDQLTDVERSLFPHVMNLTRNIVIRSENPTTVARRGHCMFLHRATVDIQYAAFLGLGRTLATYAGLNNTTYDEFGNVSAIGTNQIGRYSVHLHHLYGPENPDNTGYQWSVAGNVVEDFVKWGVTFHDSHFGLFAGNIGYAGFGVAGNGSGSAFATEDGNESFNDFIGNIVCHSKAGSSQRIRGTSGVGGVFRDVGISRDGWWFRGQNNRHVGNVVCNAPDFAYNINGGVNTGPTVFALYRIPRFRGADMHDDANVTLARAAIIEWKDNEVYGATGQGLWISNPQGQVALADYEYPNLFQNDRMWHCSDIHIFDWGQDIGNEFLGTVIRGDIEVARTNELPVVGIWTGDTYYINQLWRVAQFDIQGCHIGIKAPFRTNRGDDPTNRISTIEDGFLACHVGIEDRPTRFNKFKTTVIRNVRYEQSISLPPLPLVSETPRTIWMHFDQGNAHTYETEDNRTIVYQHNGVEGDDFELFFLEQLPDILIPSYRTSRRGLPDPRAICFVEGLTNRQCWVTHQHCIGRHLAPVELDGDAGEAATARAAERGILGLLYPIQAVVEPPPPPPPPGTTEILEGYWKFDESDGLSALDSSGNNRTGTIEGVLRNPSGKFGGCLEFNGSSHVNLGVIGKCDKITVAAWCRGNLNASGILITNGDSNTWELIQVGVSLYFYVNGAKVQGQAGAPNGVDWVHYAGSYDGEFLRVFKNGIELAKLAYALPLKSTTQPARIGNRATGTSGWKGLLDEVRIIPDAVPIPPLMLETTSPVEPPVDPVATFVEVKPESLSVQVGSDGLFTAAVLDQFGDTIPGLTIIWESSDSTVATIENGVVTAVKSGTATITASHGELSESVEVTVLPADEPPPPPPPDPETIVFKLGQTYKVRFE